MRGYCINLFDLCVSIHSSSLIKFCVKINYKLISKITIKYIKKITETNSEFSQLLPNLKFLITPYSTFSREIIYGIWLTRI